MAEEIGVGHTGASTAPLRLQLRVVFGTACCVGLASLLVRCVAWYM